ncbi:MAG: hypothetical protein DRG30_04730 [Epsilonproteobacteria bacterium]|nr:MAG: hypothetical protein DRG30_04730 [Campylobacterota bacterium]
MKTIQIENREIENFISHHYGDYMQSLWQDFATFVKVSLTDSYPTITKDEAKKRVSKSIAEIEDNSAKMLSQEEYDKEMNLFMKSL